MEPTGNVNIFYYTCGFLSELNALQEELRGTGFVILGFPCNQFGLQEPGSNDEILNGLK